MKRATDAPQTQPREDAFSAFQQMPARGETQSATATRAPWGAIATVLLLVVLAAIWFGSGPGLTKRPSRPAFITRDTGNAPPPRAVSVRVASSTARDFQPTVTLQGTTGAARQVTLRSEVEGRLVELPVNKGERVSAGELIARISVGTHAARLREAEAQLRLRTLEYEAITRLHTQGYRAQTNVAQAQANLEASRADRERALKAIADTQIRAPFAGVLNRRDVEIGDYVQVADPIAIVLDLASIIVSGHVAERDRTRLHHRQRAAVRFLDASTAEGTVRYISALADADTRTYRVEVELANPQHKFVAGQTVQISIPGTAVAAHQIPTSTLTVNDDGQLGVKLVDQNGQVVFQAVTILSQSHAGVWVSDLPAQCRIVVVDQEFVATGTAVSAVDIGPLRARMY